MAQKRTRSELIALIPSYLGYGGRHDSSIEIAESLDHSCGGFAYRLLSIALLGLSGASNVFDLRAMQFADERIDP